MSVTTAAPPTRLSRRLGGAHAIWLYSLALFATAAVTWGSVIPLGAAPVAAHVHLPWWAIALVVYLTEAYVVHVHFRREAHTVSFGEVGLVVGLFALSPGMLLLAQLVGGAAALVVHRRQRPVKIFFNLAQFAVTTAAAVIVFRAVVSLGRPFGGAGVAAGIGAAVVASLFGLLLVTVAIAVVEGEWMIQRLPVTLLISTVATFTTATFVLVAIELVRLDPELVFLLAVPCIGMGLALQYVTMQHRRQEHLEFFYESMQTTQSAKEFGFALSQLMSAIRHLVRAEYAEIFLLPEGTERGVRSSQTEGRETLLEPQDLTAVERFALEAAVPGATFLLPARRSEHPLDACLQARLLSDGMIAVLRRDEGPLGLLIVGDKTGDIGTFTADDAKLLETFAGHASVLIENAHLERSLAEVTDLQEELRHQAYHDALTGLPNRSLFTQRVDAALRETDDLGPSALVFMDIDDFKAINDARGHAVGDELLKEVGRRIRASVRHQDVPARLSGDEFGVLFAQTSAEEAEREAARLLATLSEAFILGGRETFIHASLGVAPTTSATSADELIRNADVAMYAAKMAGKNQYSYYEAGMHARLRRRHEFALALEHAVERDEISVMFQPILSLRTGHVVSFEALARWQHPERGAVSPADFIPVAEATALMPAIGQHVLQEACRAARLWQDADPSYAGIGVAVNLSPSEFSQERLADAVARTLLEERLDVAALTLEITESTAMSNLDEMVERMRDLRSLGLKIALDDFGTGYSSLERLDTMPLDILKIPKPFTDKLLDTSTDADFIDAFVRLADSLGLECVAEGIEHEIQVPRLVDRGCALGQGFYLARPMVSDDILGFLAAANRHDIHVTD